MPKLFLYLIAIIFILPSCIPKNRDEKEKPVARVYDDYLYLSDLNNQIPAGLKQEDSMRISRRLTEEWIRNRLLLKQAELQLPEDMADVEKQVEEYRTSLLIFKYKQKLLAQNLDSLVTEEEILNYYEENSSNYLLEDDIVQVTYLEIPVSSPEISDVRRWYRSDKLENIESLKNYCQEYAEHYLINDTNWIHFTDLMTWTPLKVDNPSVYLNYNRNIETSDSNYFYFIRINNRMKEGEVKPLSMVRGNIRTVLLNKRKLKYIQDLENTVYNDGINRNQVEIY